MRQVPFERRAERPEILVADEHRDIPDGMGPGFNEAPRLLEPPRFDVGVRTGPDLCAEVTQEGRRARERLACDGGELKIGEEIGLDGAHGPSGHRFVRRKSRALCAFPALHSGGDLDQDLLLEENECLCALAAREDAGEDVLVRKLIESNGPTELRRPAERFPNLCGRDPFVRGHGREE